MRVPVCVSRTFRVAFMMVYERVGCERTGCGVLSISAAVLSGVIAQQTAGELVEQAGLL